jgi:60 kDa SS-A/Ro ribonucleoprotein
MNDSLKFIVNRLTDPEALRKEKVHPFGILTAWNAYSRGHGIKGDLSWSPHTHVIAALEQAYLASSNNVPATGKNFLVGVDCSGSMTAGSICGVEGMTPAVASGCIALEIVKKEPWVEAKGFSGELFDLKMSKTSGLRDAIRAVSDGPVSSTDPGRLIEYAIARRLPVDVFMMITDNEVNHGKHPFMLLRQYRNQMGRNAKLVVIGMTATNITLADPSDGGMLDVVGFDSGAASVIHDFVLGNL